MAEDWQQGGFGIYVHWPFCQSKCPYCDFNSHVAASVDHDAWAKAFLSEIDRYGTELPGRVVRSVFFGGGTPSLMETETVGQILDKISDTWTLANDVEITLEANPTSVEAAKFQGFADAGINRVSLGIQALDDPSLQKLGRMHSADQAHAALDIAQTNFDRVSFDLIYARQDQTLDDWRAELAQALAMGTDHLSLYQLTIEPGTVFGARAKAGHLRGLPSEDVQADMYALTQEMCETAGLPAYEVSNHARPGQASRHNMIYWQAGDYIGIGPGAHGRITLNGQRYATETPLAPTAWLNAAAQNKGENLRDALSPSDQRHEYLMMGLRTHDGVDLNRLGDTQDLDNEINKLIEINMLEITAGTLRTTAQGRPLLNAILRELIGT